MVYVYVAVHNNPILLLVHTHLKQKSMYQYTKVYSIVSFIEHC